MTRRVVLGRFDDGVTVGLRVSLPGVDALTDDSTGPGFSFDSEWTDIVKTKLIALLSYTNYTINLGFGGGTNNQNGYIAYYTYTGYKCFMEARNIRTDGVIYDDYITGQVANTIGSNFTQSDFNTGQAFIATASDIGKFIVIIYDLSVPSG